MSSLHTAVEESNVNEIRDIIHVMPISKAPGYDSVSNEHFKYANEKFHVLMSLLIQFFTGSYHDYNLSPHN